ncbi:MAG: RNA dependent RNA polymerase, partial [Ruminiclostridium sp.]
DDYSTHITGEKFDVVIEIGKDEYKVENNVECSLLGIKPFDGAGLVDLSLAREWSIIDLEMKYIPSAFQFRFIPCGKGNVYTCDFKKFAKENEIKKIKDVWNNEHDIFDENDELLINVILTKSQFKFTKLYSDFKDWLDKFETTLHGYSRTFNISKVSDNPKQIKDEIVLSYQPFQSLNLNSKQIETLCERTVSKIKDISTDVDEFIKYRGIADNIDEDTGKVFEPDNEIYVPPFYDLMKVHKNLWYDAWVQEKVSKDIKGFKNRSCRGMVFLDGNYQTLIPDIYALAQYAFGMDVTGALKANEVYNKYWLGKGSNKIGIVRFPHIAMEWKVSKVVDVPHYMFNQMTEGTVCSIYDSMALKLNGADFDNDRVASITGLCVDAAEAQMTNTIIFEPLIKNEDEKPKYKINDMEHLIETDINGMSNNIGAVVNLITILWSLLDTASDETEKAKIENYIKTMSIIGSLTIDFVKTGIRAEIPKEIEKFIRSKKAKLPHFMQYRYPKKVTKDKNKNRNQRIKKQSETSSFSNIDCTMNRICSFMEKAIVDTEKSIKDDMQMNESGEFIWTILMKDESRNINNATYPKILNLLTELKQE